MNNALAPVPDDKPVEEMSLTADLVTLCYREIPEPERDPGMVRFRDEDFDRAASDVLERLGSSPLWVFAYGSLIWKPGADVTETRLCKAFGWHRAFCLEMRQWRGTPEQPGLMMALRRGGECTGIAQRVEDGNRHQTMVKLLRREIGGPMGYAALRLIELQSEQGPLRALCFYADPPEVADVPELPLSRVAAVLARACGHAGSGAEYLFNTVCALESANIRDTDLWELQKLVAWEIRGLYLGGAISNQTGPARIAADRAVRTQNGRS